MQVTVVIPSYNSRQFLADTLASVAAQTLLPAEVIVVDDVSTDGTPDLVRTLAGDMPFPLRVIELSRNTGGPAEPMNVGVGAARTELVALLDHDDIMLPRKLELQKSAFETDQRVGLAFSDYRWFSSNGEFGGVPAHLAAILILGTRSVGQYCLVPSGTMVALQVIDSGLIQSCSNLMFRRSDWQAVGGFDVKTTGLSDYKFKLDLCVRKPAAFVPEVLFRKRSHSDNLFSRIFSADTLKTVYRVGFESLAAEPTGFKTLRAHRRLMESSYLGSANLFDARHEPGMVAWLYYQSAAKCGISLRLAGASTKWLWREVRSGSWRFVWSAGKRAARLLGLW